MSGVLRPTSSGFRNPIAGPFVLGISSGAKMFLAVVTIALSGWFSSLPVSITVLASFIGSMLSLLFVLAFSGKLKNMSMLLVIGIMISYICSAVTDFLINFANESDIVNLTHWSLGSFSGAGWANLRTAAVIVLPAPAAVMLLSKPISAYALGEGYAQSLGVNIKLFRVMLIIFSSILSASVTAFAGPLSFVGIAVPHITRILLRTQKPHLMIPASFLYGAVFCMICDLVARTMFSPTELSVGTVTSAVGAPIVIWLMLSRKSTILKSITRHLATISGVVYIDEKNMRTMSGRDVATRMAVVLTDRIRPELMICGELVASGRYPYTNSFGRLTGRDHEIVMESLRRVHAEELYDRDFSAISDGQRQRIMLARAICQEPEIIVLDEPTSFLDIKHKIELLKILNDMAKKQKITVVMSLHEIDLACKVSDKIVCVKGDHIAAYGRPDEIFTDERICRLYDIERGSYNALLGSVELSRPSGAARYFLIDGGGYGIPYYRALQKADIPFAAGILFENDVDFVVASVLASEIAASRAFETITDETIARAKQIIDRVEAVIDCGCPIGEFNRANGVLLEYACGKLIKEVPV